jgi:hypothetical protein
VRDILGEGWPKAANALSGKLKRASPALRKAGIVIEWPTRHDGPKTIKIMFTANQREGRVDRPEAPKRPLEEADSKYFNGLDKHQAADPSCFRTITGEVPDDLDLVPSDHGPDDPESSRTIPGRSWSQPSSGPNAWKQKVIRRGKTIWAIRTIYTALSLTSDRLIRMSPLRAMATMTTIGATAGAGSYDSAHASCPRFR